MMRWIRKGNLIAGLVAAVLLSVFLAVFKDPMLKWGFRKAGRAATGAKVDIGSVRMSLLNGRLTLNRVAAADKNDPMWNLFSFDAASFQFSRSAALRAKIVISEAALTGLRFGTPRKKSGAPLVRSGALSGLERSIAKGLSPQDSVLNAEGAALHLFGPPAAKKLSPALYWIAWIRKHMAASTPTRSVSAEASPGRFGLYVEFPVQDSTPQFLLVHTSISGVLDQGPGLALEGSVTSVNSNPPLYGKPTLLNLRGGTPGQGPAMDLMGSLDQTKRPETAELSLHASGIDLSGAKLGDAVLGATILRGTARINATLRISADNWKGNALIEAGDVALDPAVGVDVPGAQRAAAILAQAKRFTATVSFEGTENDLHFHVSSDLGQAVAREIQKDIP